MHQIESKDGTPIAYQTYGEGPALVYVTGAICHRTFQPIIEDAELFARRFTVYTYDRRGRGDSGDGTAYEPQAEVEDLEAVIDAAGGSAYVYGHSSGAVLALEAALSLPTKVKKALVYDTPYAADEEEAHQFQETKNKVARLLTAGRNAGATRAFLTAIGVPWIVTLFFGLTPGWSRTVRQAHTLLYDIGLTEGNPPTDRLDGIRVPVLVGFGERSPKGVKRVADLLARAIPGSRLHEFRKHDHMIDAKDLLPVMEQFFEERP